MPFPGTFHVVLVLVLNSVLTFLLISCQPRLEDQVCPAISTRGRKEKFTSSLGLKFEPDSPIPFTVQLTVPTCNHFPNLMFCNKKCTKLTYNSSFGKEKERLLIGPKFNWLKLKEKKTWLWIMFILLPVHCQSSWIEPYYWYVWEKKE